jgi:hypothetical protein
MVDSKIYAAQVATGETFAGLKDEIAALKKGKSVEGGTYFLETNSAGTSATPEQFYGMSPNLFTEQIPPPSSIHAPSVQPIHSTVLTSARGQTGYMTGQTSLVGQNSSSPTPHASIPSSAAPSRTGEMVFHTRPTATSQQGSGPHRGPIPNSSMAYTGPSTQRVASSLHALASGTY